MKGHSKLKDRMSIALGLFLISLTVLLIIDVQLELGYTGNYRMRPNRPQQHVACVTSSPSMSSSSTEVPVKLLQLVAPNDRFPDLLQLAYGIGKSGDMTPSPANVIIDDDDDEGNDVEILPRVTKIKINANSTILEKFHALITSREMYGEHHGNVIQKLLHEMANGTLKEVKQMTGGTQLKLIMTYDNKMQALFKPMRFDRAQQTLPNHFYFTDYERHNAEIAAFHLDRLLGFRRAVPVTGRLLNITSEIFQLTDFNVLHTAFRSPAGNFCFHGKCSYYCDTGHAICGHPDMLEGSLAAFLPDKQLIDRKSWRHPWRRSYNKHKRAQWETEDDYCKMVREMAPYDQGRRLLDLIDMSVLDFLMGNMDRHHYETFLGEFGNDSFAIHLDHGRAFGKPFHDEISILAPLLQCCEIRASTLKTLLKYHNEPKSLSQAMHEAMLNDPIAPILWTPHLTALDRRVTIILSGVRECIKQANTSASSSASVLSLHSKNDNDIG